MYRCRCREQYRKYIIVYISVALFLFFMRSLAIWLRVSIIYGYICIYPAFFFICETVCDSVHIFIQCPFNDLLDDSRKKGMYESMTEKAMLTVEVSTRTYDVV